MVGHNVKKTLLTTVAACAMVMGVGIGSANAFGIEDAWNLNLSVVNGANPHGWVGLTDMTGMDHVVLDGLSTVTQTIAGFSAAGQAFSDTGYLNLVGNNPEGGGGFDPTLLHLDPFSNGFGMNVFFEFTALTGVMNNVGEIAFTPGSGTIKLWLEDDADGDSTTGDVLDLATFTIIAPSGGSDLNFFGGGGANATIDITLVQTAGLAGLYTDMGGMEFAMNDPAVQHLGNMDAFIDPNINPNPDNSGVDMFGDGVSIVQVMNAGQYNIKTIPEASSMAAFGVGLLGLMGMARRRRKTA